MEPTDSPDPPRAHTILSILTAEPDPLNSPQHAVPEAGAHFEVGSLSCEEGEEMLEMPLASDRQEISPAPISIRASLWGTSLALPAVPPGGQKWAPGSSPSELGLAGTAQGALHCLCVILERSHSTILVSHMLGCLLPHGECCWIWWNSLHFLLFIGNLSKHSQSSQFFKPVNVFLHIFSKGNIPLIPGSLSKPEP